MSIIIPLNDLASAEMSLDRYEEALATLREVIEFNKRIYGPDPDGRRESARIVWTNIALCLLELGRYPEVPEAARGAIREPEDLFSVISRAALGRALVESGRVPEGKEALDRVWATAERLGLGPHYEMLYTYQSGIPALLQVGSSDTALRLVRAWVESAKKRLGEDDAQWCEYLVILGIAELASGEKVAAQAELERALQFAVRGRHDPGTGAMVRYYLARTLVHRGRDIPRARALAKEASEELEKQRSKRPLYQALSAWRKRQWGD